MSSWLSTRSKPSARHVQYPIGRDPAATKRNAPPGRARAGRGSVSKRRALLDARRLNARQEIGERPRSDHVPARRAFKRDVVFDDERLVASANLFDEAEVAEKERLAEAPITVPEPLGEFRCVSTFDKSPPSERRVPCSRYPPVRLAERQPSRDRIGRVPCRARGIHDSVLGSNASNSATVIASSLS
jgi:hypothetical protein